jgi:hypothetical protein
VVRKSCKCLHRSPLPRTGDKTKEKNNMILRKGYEIGTNNKIKYIIETRFPETYKT